MRQRVKLAQALVHDPELLILDEPLTGMDPLMRRRTIRMIKEWARAGKSVIVSSHILHEIEAMTSNILLINNGRILAEGNVHQIRDLIDTHPHTVFVRAADPRAFARHLPRLRRCAEPEASSRARWWCRPGKPDEFYARLTALAGDRRGRRDRRGHLARRQPAGGLPVPGEVMAAPVHQLALVSVCSSRWPRRRGPMPSFLTASLRIFDLSLGRMLWSRGTVFMALVVGLPVVLALLVRVGNCLFGDGGGFRVDGRMLPGPAIFGGMIWLLYLRFIVPILAVYYGTSLIADEVEDKTITYLFTRPIPRGAVMAGKFLAYLVCTVMVVLPSVMLVYFLIVPLGGAALPARSPTC